MNVQIKSPLSRKATLVSVNISQWTARKVDKKVTRETNEKYHAREDAGRYNKLLIEATHLAKITGIVSTARALHYKMTKPWADDGPRILPNAIFVEFTNQFRVLKRDFETAVDEFCRAYPSFIEQRKIALNGLWNDADYPAAKDIRSKFNLSLTILPFPDSSDFRADIDPETADEIRAEIEKQTSDVTATAMKHTAEQIIEVVGHMAEKLGEYRNGKSGQRKFFMDSLVENVRDLAKLLPAFNLTADPNLDMIAQRIERELCVEDAKTLRANDEARATVQKSADEIVKAVGAFFA